MSDSLNRREFCKAGIIAGAAVAASGAVSAAVADEAQSGLHTWEVVPDPIADDQIAETIDAEIVIVGAGMSGMSAFMNACEGGAKTVIIEKADSYNGRGLDFSAIGTKVQKEAGIELDKGAILNDLIKSSGYKANGSLIRLWADHSGWVFDRLIDMTVADGGAVVLGEGSKAGADGEDFATRAYPTDHMFGGLIVGSLDLIGRMEKAGKECGGESYYNTKAEQLVRDADGRVSAVIAQRTDGTYVKFTASKGVILASGDYGSNEEMIAAWSPLILNAEANVYSPAGLNTGDGINMAMWIGAAIQPSCHAAMIHPIFGGGALSTASVLKVNSLGMRFCNENTTLPGISNMHMTNRGKVWSIFDDDYEAQYPGFSGLSKYNDGTAGPVTAFYLAGTMDPANPPAPSELVAACLENGTTVCADTIEELAEKIGVPAENLVKTVARYNELVELGEDLDYKKGAADLNPVVKPPFYASRLTSKVLAIASGLDVDSNMNVLDKEGEPIAGLYAVGNVMGNFFANDYPICCPGLSHGRCLTLGALIGKALATDTTVQAL
ncbi:MAG: FAD-binding protein [Coriobacteriales bacterium]|nr:FAD-binding protein [Coriobacteriales bacterium]